MYLLKESWPNKFILHFSLNISHRLCYLKSVHKTCIPVVRILQLILSDVYLMIWTWIHTKHQTSQVAFSYVKKCMKEKLVTHLFKICLYVQPRLDCVHLIPADCSSLLPQSLHGGTLIQAPGSQRWPLAHLGLLQAELLLHLQSVLGSLGHSFFLSLLQSPPFPWEFTAAEATDFFFITYSIANDWKTFFLLLIQGLTM